MVAAMNMAAGCDSATACCCLQVSLSPQGMRGPGCAGGRGLPSFCHTTSPAVAPLAQARAVMWSSSSSCCRRNGWLRLTGRVPEGVITVMCFRDEP